MVATYGIHWFRQDLRLQENPSLLSLSKKVDQIIPNLYFRFKSKNWIHIQMVVRKILN